MKIYSILMMMGLLLSACERDLGENGQGEPADGLIEEVKILEDPTNVLRMEVGITTKEEISLELEYWKDGAESTKKQLRFGKQERQWAIKLILLEEKASYWLKVTAMNEAGAKESKHYQFTTKALPNNLMQFTNLMPDYTYAFDGYIHVGDKKQGTLYLINSEGKIVWYQPTDGLSVICSSFDSNTKTFQAILGFNPNESFTGEYIYVVDLYGNVKLKKHFTELSNPYFHHDIQMLDEEALVVVNQVKQPFDLTRWGGSSEEMVTGDGFSILDFLGNTKWVWSAFDFVSPEDDPNIMDGNGAFEFPPRGDWLHANSVARCPDGDFIISFNRTSQVWKVDGHTGEVRYKFGEGGDVSLDDPSDFPDRQHAASIAPDGSLMMYDNGYTLKRSRIMAYRIDEITKKAVVTLKVILPQEDFSPNQSSAYWMDKEHLLFGSVVPATLGVIDKNGNLMWHYKTNNSFYRALYIDLTNLINRE